MKRQLWQLFRDYALITAGALILATNVVVFLTPNHVVSTGITGLGMLAHYLWGWPIGMVTLALNIPLFLAGIRWGDGLKFFVRTIYAVVLMTLAIDLLAPRLPPITGEALIYTLFGGLLDGVGIGLVLRGRGTTGGTDIIAQLLNRHRGIPFSSVFLAANTLILFLAAFVVGIVPILYALIVNYVSARVVDVVQEGISYARTLFIVSREHERVRRAILDELGRGVTVLEAYGGYTLEKRPALYVVVGRSQVTVLKRIIAEIDPHAFVVVAEAHEVLGEGFRPVRSEP